MKSEGVETSIIILSSRDGAHWGPKKNTCRKESLSKCMIDTSFDQPLFSLDNTFKINTQYTETNYIDIFTYSK
jgi:hypothetical protein